MLSKAEDWAIRRTDNPVRLIDSTDRIVRPTSKLYHYEEGYSRLTFELEPQSDAVKLTVIHEMDKANSTLIEAVSSGCPLILASLKSLLETGESLEATRRWPEGM